MKVKKVKGGGYRVETSVGGYPFAKVYRGCNRVCAIGMHKAAENSARRYGCRWIDRPEFNEYN